MTEKPTSAKIEFGPDLKPRMGKLSDSLVQFGMWSDEHLAQDMPIQVQLPEIILKRVERLNSYLTAESWPKEVPVDAKKSIYDVVNKIIPVALDEISCAVRQVVASTLRDDGSRAVSERDRILDSYLSAKALALARALDAYWLIGEEPWSLKQRFRRFKTVWSPRIVYGLAPIFSEIGAWSGWTEADFHILGRHQRVYLPILSVIASENDLSKLERLDLLALLVPQIVEQRKCSYEALNGIIFDYEKSFCTNLMYRDEVFLDAETYTDHHHAKKYIERIAATKLAEKLETIEVHSERDIELLKLAMKNHGLDLVAKVKEIIATRNEL